MGGVREVAHHRLHLHPVAPGEQTDDLLALVGMAGSEDPYGGVAGGHGRSFARFQFISSGHYNNRFKMTSD
jgi:hypothetical protein